MKKRAGELVKACDTVPGNIYKYCGRVYSDSFNGYVMRITGFREFANSTTLVDIQTGIMYRVERDVPVEVTDLEHVDILVVPSFMTKLVRGWQKLSREVINRAHFPR